jgi:hypothetical protein
MRKNATGLLAWLKWLFGKPSVRRSLISLRGLSNRQLNDAGIDLTLAGRGRAADVTIDPNMDVRS